MKVTFLGAGSTVFAKNVLGDIIMTESIKDIDIALYDIDNIRLDDSYTMIKNIINNSNRADIKLNKYLGVDNLKDALSGADFAVNAIQIGGYKPCTVTDFEIPKKYRLKQTIADTIGIGGLFRALRTIPVMQSFADVIEKVCPNVILLNYTNPMSSITGYMLRYTKVKTVGLCHSVQGCAKHLLRELDMESSYDNCKWEVAGINHQAWLLKIVDKYGNDLYPEIKKRAKTPEKYKVTDDLVRLKILNTFGYYNTESSEHTAEYLPYFIKERYPELINEYNIPLDEYPRRCVRQIKEWEDMRHNLVNNKSLNHNLSDEYAAKIINAVVNDKPYEIHGNVINTSLITNLPDNACVEVPCMVNRNGITPCYVGALPEQLAALNRTNINTQLLTIEAAATLKKEYIYMAALLDPHTSSELSIDDTISMCDDLIAAHKGWLPEYK